MSSNSDNNEFSASVVVWCSVVLLSFTSEKIVKICWVSVVTQLFCGTWVPLVGTMNMTDPFQAAQCMYKVTKPGCSLYSCSCYSIFQFVILLCLWSLNKEDAMDRCKWRKVIKEVRWPGWVLAGECFFWYRPTRVVPDKRPLNGCCCCCHGGKLEQIEHFLLKGIYRPTTLMTILISSTVLQTIL